eukprot:gnl/Chilomastix_cuspidata/3680.p2 GENE.gnl/Chilomastix_cuspidata/3680~~gnl/Chilomastix_cuspidata/3680.p2  ORF type:complete len:226 (-),score=14.94 gnl/Chilomastix_cuspidata/3680:1021-1698(-)
MSQSAAGCLTVRGGPATVAVHTRRGVGEAPHQRVAEQGPCRGEAHPGRRALRGGVEQGRPPLHLEVIVGRGSAAVHELADRKQAAVHLLARGRGEAPRAPEASALRGAEPTDAEVHAATEEAVGPAELVRGPSACFRAPRVGVPPGGGAPAAASAERVEAVVVYSEGRKACVCVSRSCHTRGSTAAMRPTAVRLGAALARRPARACKLARASAARATGASLLSAS